MTDEKIVKPRLFNPKLTLKKSQNILSFFGAIWYFIKVLGLMKLDVNKNISDNIYHINKYNIRIKKEKFAMNYIIGPPAGILFILTFLEAKATFALWVFLACALLLSSISTYWGYKRFYQKNTDSIRKSLEEIKDLSLLFPTKIVLVVFPAD